MTEVEQIRAALMTPWDRSGSCSLCTVCDNAGDRAEIFPSQGVGGEPAAAVLDSKAEAEVEKGSFRIS